jgi:alcohol dehydrogenase
MRAAVIREHGDRNVIVIEDNYAEPSPKPGWVKLRVRSCSLNYHDIFSRRGMPGITLPFPLITGSDIAGEIAELGEGVSGWVVGERVLVDPEPIAEMDFKFVGEQLDGGRAEFCCVHAAQLVRIPEAVSYEQAASLPLAYATAYRMLVTRGNIKKGEKVLILGASGGVGTGCVLLSKMMGCEVIACASSMQKLDRLKEIGADHVIDYKEQNFRKAAWEIVGKPGFKGGGGVDVVVNATGGSTWKDSIRCLSKGGRLLTCGATAGFEEEVDLRYIWTYELDIRGSDGWQRCDLETLLKNVEDGSLLPVIDCVMPLDEIQEAERRMEDREVFGKIVINI